MNKPRKPYWKQLFVGVALVLTLTLVLVGGRTAVASTNDIFPVPCEDGVGDAESLLLAIGAANSDPDEDRIVLGENCTYTLTFPTIGGTNGLPAIKADLILEGNNATIERSTQSIAFRLLEVSEGISLNASDLTLRNGLLTLHNGGAIHTGTGSKLQLLNVALENNKAVEGGAIFTQGTTFINNSRFHNNKATGKGGGLHATAALTLTGSTFTDNEGQAGGGAIYAARAAVVVGSNFVENFTDIDKGDGGAILADNALTVNGTHFAFNAGRHGGAVHSNDTSILTSTFFYNTARGNGGAVHATNARRGVSNTRFDQNQAVDHGGGLYVLSELNLRSSFFHRNETGGEGGGLYLYSSSAPSLIENNLWVDNDSTESERGNAMSLVVLGGGPVSVRHNTAVSNEAFQSGSAILIANSAGVLKNNILTSFDIAIEDKSGTAVSRSNLYFANLTNEKGFATPGENILVADPLFVGEGNYRLSEGSEAINSATTTETFNDILGTPRPQGGLPDRGAYEFNGEEEKIFSVACTDGAAELAAAITAANRHFGPDVIELEGADCLYELTTALDFGYEGPVGLPVVMDILRLDGRGATLQRSGTSAPFRLLDTYAPLLTLENLIMRNGRAVGNSGGAVLAYYGTDLHLDGVTLRNNEAGFDGGAVYAYETLTIENSQVTNNRATDGGGIASNGDLIISNSIVANNEAIGDGGGVYIRLAGEIANTQFTGNQADENGGALYVGTQVDLQTSTFTDNTALNRGGGLYVNHSLETNRVVNNVWLRNRAARGAAVNIQDTNSSSQVNLLHNTVVGEQTPEVAAIELFSSNDNHEFFVANNIIVTHAVGVQRSGINGKLITSHNLYFDNETNEVGATSSNNHIEADPGFRDLPNGDVRLLEGSAAINNGDDLGVLIDRNGILRPQEGGFDIGAHEFVRNTLPTAAPDSYATAQNTPLEIPAPGVLGNDKDEDGNPLTAVLSEIPADGTLTFNANGSFTYTPDADFIGTIQFTYRADDGFDQSQPATVTINVLPLGNNVPPVALPDAYATKQNTSLEITAPGVLDNDLDTDGDPLKAVLEAAPANGSLMLAANGSFSYTPTPGFLGIDSFSYRANDGEDLSAPVPVVITVVPAEGNLPPLAFGNRYELNEGDTLTVPAPGILTNDQDGDGDRLTAVLESPPAHGTLTLNADGECIFVPDPGFSGVDNFTYRASDGRTLSNPATVTIIVRPAGGRIHELLLPLVARP